MREPRHCEERSDEANQEARKGAGLLRFARNDGAVRVTSKAIWSNTMRTPTESPPRLRGPWIYGKNQVRPAAVPPTPDAALIDAIAAGHEDRAGRRIRCAFRLRCEALGGAKSMRLAPGIRHDKATL